jgi:hypothetical protein
VGVQREAAEDVVAADRVEGDRIVCRVHRMDVPGTQRLRADIAKIERDDRRCSGPDGGGEHVPVFGIVKEYRFEAIGCIDDGLGEVIFGLGVRMAPKMGNSR